MTVHVTIAGQDFNAPTAHTDPVRWSLDIDAGWDSPDLDMELLPTIGEGSAAGRIMVRHRTIVCKGFVEARDDTDYWLARATVENLVPAYTEVPFVVHEPTGAQQVMVRSSPGSPRIRDNAGHFEFQLTLVALDPTKHPVA